ncbi:sugar ABC transporter ATP-binding protein [Acididesulfobacillus acetoxydans]|nr:sugar ABC transporter ATP-binding protein [Acididesulfobacillus acetoxydans]
MDNIVKEFPGVKALDGVTFKVKRGEIHCLVGENGAGKSTLMKILSGVYPAGTFSGKIILDSTEQHFNKISDSERAGIAIIYQELALIPELTIYENIFFGHELGKGQFIDWNETIVQAKEMLKRIHVNINPETKIKDVGVGVQQLVEIGKALSKNVKLLILDEPTAALSEVDCDNLFQILRGLKEQGVTCIMISHKLREVISIADSITVLRDGKTIISIDATERKVGESEIIKYMVGREIKDIYPKRKGIKVGDVCFELKNWTAFDPNKGRKILRNIDFYVRQGEVVGIAGLMGAGRTEMALSIFGNTKHYDTKGALYVNGVKRTFNSPERAIAEKIAYVTEDRKGNGLILIQDIKFNTTLANLKQLLKGFFINEHEEVHVAKKFFDEVGIRAQSIEQSVGTLSGGNQQKVSLAKWLFSAPKLLILDEPTRGIDVGAKFEIYTIMNELVKRGVSIIMISSELPEILGMSDRIYVMSDGTMTGVLDAKDATEEKIMEMATA